MNKTKVKTAAVSGGLRVRLLFSAAALTLALLAAPHAGHAQGLVRGVQDGAAQGGYDGGRVAGPVGEVVGGAVGAGVGGAVGVVDGALGIPNRGWHHRCRGYHDSYGHFRCYR
jgi:hypothetical protein